MTLKEILSGAELEIAHQGHLEDLELAHGRFVLLKALLADA